VCCYWSLDIPLHTPAAVVPIPTDPAGAATGARHAGGVDRMPMLSVLLTLLVLDIHRAVVPMRMLFEPVVNVVLAT